MLCWREVVVLPISFIEEKKNFHSYFLYQGCPTDGLCASCILWVPTQSPLPVLFWLQQQPRSLGFLSLLQLPVPAFTPEGGADCAVQPSVLEAWNAYLARCSGGGESRRRLPRAPWLAVVWPVEYVDLSNFYLLWRWLDTSCWKPIFKVAYNIGKCEHIKLEFSLLSVGWLFKF